MVCAFLEAVIIQGERRNAGQRLGQTGQISSGLGDALVVESPETLDAISGYGPSIRASTHGTTTARLEDPFRLAAGEVFPRLIPQPGLAGPLRPTRSGQAIDIALPHHRHRVLEVPGRASVWLHERVSTFPGAVAVGTLACAVPGGTLARADAAVGPMRAASSSATSSCFQRLALCNAVFPPRSFALTSAPFASNST